MPTVSILVPCYNSERYLEECLRSVLGQTYPDLEVVCVDDGSTDGTLSILQSTGARDDRVRIVRQTNQGAAEARRTALRTATGEFVCAVDSDDWIDQDCILRALEKAESEGADIVLFALKHWFGGQVVRHQTFDGLPWPMSGAKALEYTLDGWKIHGLGLFRRSVFERAYEEFDQYRLLPFNADDFVARVALHAARKVERVSASYHYRAHPNATTLKADGQWLGYLSALEATGGFLAKVGESDRLLVPYISDCFKHSNYLLSVWADARVEMPDDLRQEGIQRIFAFWSRLPKRGLLRYAREKRLPLRERIRLLLIVAGLYPLVYGVASHIRSRRFA